MKFKALSGRLVDIRNIHRYRVDWDGDQGSKFSEDVLDFLEPYWKHDIVFAELPVAGKPRMRYDFVNLSKKVIVESDGAQHDAYNAHMHGGSQERYKDQIKRDLFKDRMAEINGFTMVRVKPHDLPLTKDWFLQTWGVTL